MENMMKTMREYFPTRTVMLEQSLDMFGITRGEDGKLIFPLILITVSQSGVSASVCHLMAGAESV